MKNKIRVPVHQSVRFEILNHERLILRRRTMVPVGEGEAVEVDQPIEMTFREWKKLVRAVKKGRNRKKERTQRRMATIRRPAPTPGLFGS